MRNRVGDKQRLLHILKAITEIEWQQITGMRHVLVHEYFGIDNYLIWQAIAKDVPDLKAKVKKAIDNIESSEP